MLTEKLQVESSQESDERVLLQKETESWSDSECVVTGIVKGGTAEGEGVWPGLTTGLWGCKSTDQELLVFEAWFYRDRPPSDD